MGLQRAAGFVRLTDCALASLRQKRSCVASALGMMFPVARLTYRRCDAGVK